MGTRKPKSQRETRMTYFHLEMVPVMAFLCKGCQLLLLQTMRMTHFHLNMVTVMAVQCKGCQLLLLHPLQATAGKAGEMLLQHVSSPVLLVKIGNAPPIRNASWLTAALRKETPTICIAVWVTDLTTAGARGMMPTLLVPCNAEVEMMPNARLG